MAPLTFQRTQQARLLPADVGARPAMYGQLQVVAASQDVLAQVAPLVSLGGGPFQPFRARDVFAPDVDKSVFHLAGVAGDNYPFDQAMRIVLDERPILEGARLALVGVADQVAGVNARWQKAPFDPGRKTGSAPTPQAGTLYQVNQVGGLEFLQGFFQSLIPAPLQVNLYFVGVFNPHVSQQDFFWHKSTLLPHL